MLGRPSQSQFLRGLAACLVVVTLTAQLLSLAHVATVSHVTCAEHGESVELSGVSEGESHHHAGTCLRQAEAASDHHDHCVIASFRRERSTSAPSLHTGLELTPPAYALSFARIASAAAPPIALIRLAPKLPPPSHA